MTGDAEELRQGFALKHPTVWAWFLTGAHVAVVAIVVGVLDAVTGLRTNFGEVLAILALFEIYRARAAGLNQETPDGQ